MSLPDGWSYKPLEEIADKISDGIHTTPQYVDKSEIYFVNGNNIKGGRLIVGKSTKCVPESEWQKHKKDLSNRTILLSINGTIGNLAYYNGEKVVLGKSAAYINVKEDISKEFLYYLLDSKRTKDYFDSELTGSTIKNLSLKAIKSLVAPLPPLLEQKKIAEILTTWDKSIAQNETLLAKVRQWANTLCKRTFAKLDLEFPCVTLMETGEIVSGGTPDTSNKELWDGGVSWVTPTDITALKNKYLSQTSRTISELGLKDSAAKLLPVGSLVVCTRATVGALAITTVPLTTNQGFKNIIPKETFDSLFLYYAVREKKSEMIRLAAGSTFLEISKGEFSKIKIPAPPIDRQKRVAAALDLMDQQMGALTEKIALLKNQKQGLMQKLLTGKVRVKV